ncbi:unnamed protein product [Prorocentrum cordatum]|uniref:Staphylococcus aureus surface protein A n=1 Tax=Prorocentrum cordatum TaxID=2364126 RepID=A0ABN9WWQ6_9DINO|nr:unnamed protein product [Polarella glacialis]
MSVVVQVAGVNDRPLLDIYQDRQAIPEDPGEPVLLSPLFVTDADAGSSPLELTFDLAEGHDDNRLHMCGLFQVDLREPLEHTLDEGGCLPGGASRLRFRATLEAFNSMQAGAGRLRFLPAPDWHGAALVNITVDDLGSGLGEAARQTASRALHLAVEPAVDPPRVRFLCEGAAPLVSYGSACLEVRGCLELSAGADDLDEDTSMWLSVSISEPSAALSLEDAAPVRVWNEGTASLRVLGLYRNVRDSLGALVIRPPPGIFSGKEDPEVLSYEISVAVVALGQLFNDPLPSSFDDYPNDSLTFPVEFRRVNEAPRIFSDIVYFSASQLNPSVGLPGLFVLDADAHDDDLVEITFEVDPTSAGGAVSFAGWQDVSITRRMNLSDLNQELHDLSFTFQDDSWFGVTALTVSVTDLGHRGWNVKGYKSTRHQETKPQVLSLRGGSVSLLPDDTYQYFSLFSGDFTWEVFCKRLLPSLTDTTLGTTASLFTQPSSATPASDILFRNLPLGVDINSTDFSSKFVEGAGRNDSNVSGPPVVSIEIDVDGYPTVLLRSDAGLEVFERGGTRLAVGTWHHLALVVRRSGHAEAPGKPSDTTLGEVVLYVDGAVAASRTVAAGRAAFMGPASGAVLALAGAAAAPGAAPGASGGVALSRARLWGRALAPAELAACAESPRRACEDDDAGAIAMAHLLGETVRGCADIGDMCSNPAHGHAVRSTCCHTCSMFEADAGVGHEHAALAFLFEGSLGEESGRTAARPVGSWSFDLDAPPPCLGLNQRPFDSLFEHCVCYDRSLDEDGAGYVWHSPQAYAAMTSGMRPYANNTVHSSRDEGHTVSVLLSVYRYFVNRPPSIALLEPASGVLITLEGSRVAPYHPSFVVLEVSHRAAEQMVPRPLAVALSTEHGRVRSLSTAAATRLAFDRRRVEYRAPLHELNEFLSQLEYTPDPNYAGDDVLFVTVTDLEFTINASVPIVVSPLSDPLSLVCPPGIDVLEGSQVNPIGANFSVHDGDQLPGHSDEETLVEVRLTVGGGSLRLLPGALAGSASLQQLLLSAGNGVDLESLMNDTFAPVPAIVFETTIGGLRDVLAAVAFTPYPVLFHGVIHLGLEVTVIARGESARCDVGIVVHPVNSPPAIRVDHAQLERALGGPTMSPQRNVSLAGVFLLSDPDEEDFFGWFADRTHSGRMGLNVTCGSLSFGEYGDRDYVNGAQHGSIAGREGMTFWAGDGSRDPHVEALSTP